MTFATAREWQLTRDLNAARTELAQREIAAAQDKARIAQLTAVLSGIAAEKAQATLATLKDEREAMGEKRAALKPDPQSPSDDVGLAARAAANGYG